MSVNEGEPYVLVPEFPAELDYYFRPSSDLETQLLGVGEEEEEEKKSKGKSKGKRSKKKKRVDVAELRRYVDGEHWRDKDVLREFLATDPLFRLGNESTLPLGEQRLLTKKRAIAIVRHPMIVEQIRQPDMVNKLEMGFAYSEVLGFTDLSCLIKCGVHSYLFMGSLMGLGTDEQMERWLDDLAELRMFGMFMMTELGHGSNVRAIETTATYDAQTEEFIVHSPTKNSMKVYIGNALHGNHGVVFARLIVDGSDYGPQAFLVRMRDANDKLLPGITVRDLGPKMGLNGIDNGCISFDSVRIPRGNMLQRLATVSKDGKFSSILDTPTKRFNATLLALLPTRVSVICSAIAVMKVALTVATRYSMNRVQFGPSTNDADTAAREMPIMNFQTHQKRLLPALAMVYALDFTRKQVGRMWGEHVRLVQADPVKAFQDRESEALISGLKALATWEMIRTVQNCRECCGGAGFMMENRLASLRMDCDIFVTFEGDNTVLYQQVAKDLLAQYAEQFASSKFTGALSFLTGGVLQRARNLFLTGNVYSFDFLRYALAFKETRLLHTLAARLLWRVKKNEQDSFLAWNECLDHLITLAKTHVERIVLDSFLRGVREAPKGASQIILRKLCRLYALSRIDEDRVWYLEQGVINANGSTTVRNLMIKLSSEIAPHCLDLVDVWGVPQSCVKAPIAAKL